MHVCVACAPIYPNDYHVAEKFPPRCAHTHVEPKPNDSPRL